MQRKLIVVDIYHGNLVGGSGPALAGFQQAYAAGVRGVIHKATQGDRYTDPRYRSRRKPAIDAGMLWGAYHFGDASDVSRQVDRFVDMAQPDETTLMALDWEENGDNTMSLDQARLFLALLGRLLGRKPVLYSGNTAKEKMGDHVYPFFSEHRLWLAQYGQTWKVQASWKKPWLWQYAESGHVPGISGEVDHNAYDGTPEQLAAEWAS
jgi:GH25 family lysozyme M1 (1,4-beta-N-acetylmuramidase)